MASYLVITELFLPTKGGTAVWFDEVYRRIGDRRTHVVTAAVPGSKEHDSGHPNTVHRLKLERIAWLWPESLGMYWKLFWRAFGLALTRRFTAIHAGRALPEGFVAWLIGRITLHRVVVYAHGEELTTWGQGGKFKAMRFVLRHADIVISNSEYTRAELLKLGVAESRIVLINPGVDIDRFRPAIESTDLRASLGLGSNDKLLLSVGRLSRRKGFDTVISALPNLLQTGFSVHYALVGVGEDRDYLTQLAEKLGVAARVHLLGHVHMEDLPRWYNACDIFLMPNREIDGDTEGFGIVFIEAAACGKPSIAGKAGGTGAAVLHNTTGIIVEGASCSDVTEAAASLLNSTEYATSLGVAGRERVVREFSWNIASHKITQLANE